MHFFFRIARVVWLFLSSVSFREPSSIMELPFHLFSLFFALFLGERIDDRPFHIWLFLPAHSVTASKTPKDRSSPLRPVCGVRNTDLKGLYRSLYPSSFNLS